MRSALFLPIDSCGFIYRFECGIIEVSNPNTNMCQTPILAKQTKKVNLMVEALKSSRMVLAMKDNSGTGLFTAEEMRHIMTETNLKVNSN